MAIAFSSKVHDSGIVVLSLLGPGCVRAYSTGASTAQALSLNPNDPNDPNVIAMINAGLAPVVMVYFENSQTILGAYFPPEPEPEPEPPTEPETTTTTTTTEPTTTTTTTEPPEPDPYEHFDMVIANLNPIRYRGYYYDNETGYYFLQTRYYSPEWRRFINADCLFIAGNPLTASNMYAYCNGNPVMKIDPRGMEARFWPAGYEDFFAALVIIAQISVLVDAFPLTMQLDIIEGLMRVVNEIDTAEIIGMLQSAYNSLSWFYPIFLNLVEYGKTIGLSLNQIVEYLSSGKRWIYQNPPFPKPA